MVVTWPSNVNKIILDDMSLSIGGKGYVEDKADSGKYKKRRLVRNYVPEEYTINMEFDFVETDSDGNTEYSRFMNWYENVHKRGVNPFQFKSIRRTTDVLPTYRITSQLAVSKHGLKQRVAMTWTEDNPGHINTYYESTEWLDSVNMKILESTNYSTSDGGVIETTGANSEFSERHLNEEDVPDSYSVTMDFDWLNRDEYGKSEFDRFVEWYEFAQKYGTKTFTFASLKYYKTQPPYVCYINGKFAEESEYINSVLNNSKAVNERKFRSGTVFDTYRITSGLKAVKSGYCMRVTMTWENVVVKEERDIDVEFTVDHIEVENGLLHVVYTSEITETPTLSVLYGTSVSSLSSLTLDTENITINGCEITIPFDKLSSGNYYFTLSTSYSSTSSLCTVLGVK